MRTEPLTICTWLWRQPGCRTRYTAEHVNTWARMVARHTSIPHRLVCFTNMPEGVEIETRPLPEDFSTVHNKRWSPKDGKPQCYRRLAMFRRDAAEWIGPRFASMDLDCIVFGSLDPLFEREEDLVLFRGTGPRRPYNGSLLLMDAGARPAVYEDFTQARAEQLGRHMLGSDQAWLMHKLGPNEAKFTDSEGVRHHTPAVRRMLRCGPCTRKGLRLLFFPGRVKPWDLLHEPTVREHYQ